MISSESSFWRFFSRMVTTSVAVYATSARSTSSIGPGARLDSRSESRVMAWPEGLVATNFCSPIHFTDAVCMRPPIGKDSRRKGRNERAACRRRESPWLALLNYTAGLGFIHYGGGNDRCTFKLLCGAGGFSG